MTSGRFYIQFETEFELRKICIVEQKKSNTQNMITLNQTTENESQFYYTNWFNLKEPEIGDFNCIYVR